MYDLKFIDIQIIFAVAAHSEMIQTLTSFPFYLSLSFFHIPPTLFFAWLLYFLSSSFSSLFFFVFSTLRRRTPPRPLCPWLFQCLCLCTRTRLSLRTAGLRVASATVSAQQAKRIGSPLWSWLGGVRSETRWLKVLARLVSFFGLLHSFHVLYPF